MIRKRSVGVFCCSRMFDLTFTSKSIHFCTAMKKNWFKGSDLFPSKELVKKYHLIFTFPSYLIV